MDSLRSPKERDAGPGTQAKLSFPLVGLLLTMSKIFNLKEKRIKKQRVANNIKDLKNKKKKNPLCVPLSLARKKLEE